MINQHKIVIAVTGASGAIYAKLLLDTIHGEPIMAQINKTGIIFSNTAKEIWKYEIGKPFNCSYPSTYYEKDDFNAPFASGSSDFRTMIICPCSMGTLGRIASGCSDDLVTRAADVMLKERGKLILMPRETPYNLIHIRNMEILTRAGAVICPASPSFYSKPQTIDDLVKTVVNRVLDIAGIEIETFRWNNNL